MYDCDDKSWSTCFFIDPEDETCNRLREKGPIYLAIIVLIKKEDLKVDFVLYNREKTCEGIILRIISYDIIVGIILHHLLQTHLQSKFEWGKRVFFLW